mmetsp:Transcript_17401/g.55873  ORF Transcript_17401/g.55873 Transcript_17401/m.55873 type:complete len:210 (+) Transcript_17401:2-631(+)
MSQSGQVPFQSDVSVAAMNREQAIRAKELGQQALRDQDFVRAARLLAKSQRLCPSPHTASLLQRARERVEASQTAHSAPQPAPSQTAPSTEASASSDPLGAILATDMVQRVRRSVNGALSHFPEPYRRPLLALFVAICIAATYRLLGGPSLSTLGAASPHPPEPTIRTPSHQWYGGVGGGGFSVHFDPFSSLLWSVLLTVGLNMALRRR